MGRDNNDIYVGLNVNVFQEHLSGIRAKGEEGKGAGGRAKKGGEGEDKEEN